MEDEKSMPEMTTLCFSIRQEDLETPEKQLLSYLARIVSTANMCIKK